MSTYKITNTTICHFQLDFFAALFHG